MYRILIPAMAIAALTFLNGCDKSSDTPSNNNSAPAKKSTDDAHKHADGSTHDDHGDEGHAGEDHAHDEVSIGKAKCGDLEIDLAQGHGKVEAGKEGHLVVKLPYNDKGATVVRAWIGTEDKTMSMVGKGEYAASHDDYDVHAVAPSPLPEKAMWWIEIKKPDGTVHVGSAKPLT
ncbi:MAG TPA: hypothetical protein P5081_19740 [Phycisphaerae bacterium]|nr:hypothetical protein [Phycisphaerae bacterium]